MAEFTVPADGVYTDSVTGNQFQYYEGDTVPLELAVRLEMPGAELPAAGSPLPAAEESYIDADRAAAIAAALEAATLQSFLTTEARTATAAPGGGSGVISAGVDHVVVTSDDANKVITLPVLPPGKSITLVNGATGYELRSSDPATIGINGGAEANAESAIGANVHVTCTGSTATNIICSNTSAAGEVTATQVAAAA